MFTFIQTGTSFEDFLSSKLTMRQLLFVGLPPVVIDRLDREDKINSFVTHGTTFLDDNALDGFMLFTSTSTKPAMLQQVAQVSETFAKLYCRSVPFEFF